MDSSESDTSSEISIPLPAELYSSDSGKPISHCIMCEKFLLDSNTQYVIEKAYRQVPAMNVKEVIFEYAMCMECSMKMNDSLSVESRQRIQQYFQEHTNLDKRWFTLLRDESHRIDKWISTCVIKNTPVSDSSEFQIVAQCQGEKMLFTHLPFAISSEAIEEMSSLLSPKSRGEIDDFIGKYFTGPPEVSEILKRKLVFI
jgi:hypothetical protein